MHVADAKTGLLQRGVLEIYDCLFVEKSDLLDLDRVFPYLNVPKALDCIETIRLFTDNERNERGVEQCLVDVTREAIQLFFLSFIRNDIFGLLKSSLFLKCIIKNTCKVRFNGKLDGDEEYYMPPYIVARHYLWVVKNSILTNDDTRGVLRNLMKTVLDEKVNIYHMSRKDFDDFSNKMEFWVTLTKA